MANIYLTILIGLVLIGVLPIWRSGAYAYQYAGYMPLVFGIFILPQAISLVNFPGVASTDAVNAVLLMTCLCLGACLLGYRIPPWKAFCRIVSAQAKEQRLLTGGIVLLLTSAYFNFLISRMTEEETGGSMWTGAVTIYLFFTGGTFLATAIFLRNVILTGSIPAFLLFLFSLVSPVMATIFAGRRENTVQLLLTIGLVLYFEKRISPPRVLVLALAVAAMLIIPATGTYRSIASTGEWQELQQLDVFENFKLFLTTESNLELRLAAINIYNTTLHDGYVYGVGYWDEVIWRFVPAQIVGKDLKNGLMFARTEVDDTTSDRIASVGTTTTGMGDSFVQFGYFGAIFFAVVAVFYRSLWISAIRRGAVFAQLLYIGSVTSGMRAVTHQTTDFLPGVIYQLIFIGILYLISHKSNLRNNGGAKNRAVASLWDLDRAL